MSQSTFVAVPTSGAEGGEIYVNLALISTVQFVSPKLCILKRPGKTPLRVISEKHISAILQKIRGSASASNRREE
jgi:hypothetical protein